MKIDLTNLRNKTAKEVEEIKERAERRGNNEGRLPILYVGEPGKLVVRPLYNIKADLVQRIVVRHDTGKYKVPCMQMYGEECPICNAINNVQDIKGKDCGVFRSHGYKSRGFMIAQLMDHDEGMLKDDRSPKKGDIVLLMYPRQVYDQVAGELNNAGDFIYDLVAKNDGKPLIIEKINTTGAPTYKVNAHPYITSTKMFTEDVKDEEGNILTPDQQYENLLSNLEDLGEMICPSNPTEDVRKEVNALVDLINEKYLSDNIADPGKKIEQPKKEESNVGRIAESDTVKQVNNIPNNSDNRPPCFGNHSDDDNKCLICPLEPDCIG